MKQIKDILVIWNKVHSDYTEVQGLLNSLKKKMAEIQEIVTDNWDKGDRVTELIKKDMFDNFRTFEDELKTWYNDSAIGNDNTEDHLEDFIGRLMILGYAKVNAELGDCPFKLWT